MNELSGPAIHIGVALAVALLFRLNLVIAIFCGILPDLVDKSLAIFGIGGGRYVGHSLIFTFVVLLVFYLWKRRFGFSAIVGLGTHLILDLDGLIPWFYPFVNYNFTSYKFDITMWMEQYLNFSKMGIELIVLACAICGALFIRWIYQLLYNKIVKSKEN